MAKLGWPPNTLPDLVRGDLITIRRGTVLWRVYRSGGSHPSTWGTFRSFGPTATGRFDHHEAPPHEDAQRAILYAALDGPAAIAESFQDSRTIERNREDPYLVAFALARDLVALDLSGDWPTRAGCSQAISSGRRDMARAWSRSVYGSYPDVQALHYPSGMAGGSRNVALYERARDVVPYAPKINLPLSHPGLDGPLGRVATRLGYDLI